MSEKNLALLLKNMRPSLHAGTYVFCSREKIEGLSSSKIIGLFQEKEGTSLILTKEYAQQNNISYDGTFSWITLEVNSSLEAVGLTASFATALTKNNISCNVVAGYYHDHIFVQEEKAKEALNVLIQLSHGS